MFGVKITMAMTPKTVQRATDKGAYKTFKHAANSIAKSAGDSMVEAEGPSRPGTPPHAHTKRLRWSIQSNDPDSDGVFIGPTYSRVIKGGRPPWLAKMLEFGGTFTWKRRTKKRGRPSKREAQRRAAGYGPPMMTATYPARPFMQPALERNLARFHRDWKGAI